MEIEGLKLGDYYIVKELPPQTRLLMAWNAVWELGRRTIKKAQAQPTPSGTYIMTPGISIPITPMIENGTLFCPDDVNGSLARPGVELVVVVKLRFVEKTKRSSKARFPAITEMAVSKVDGDAWLVKEIDFRACEQGHKAVPLGTKFNLPALIGLREFNGLVSKLRTMVRKM